MVSPVEAVVLVLSSVVQTFGLRVGTEQPPYAVVEQAGPVEIRRYEPRLAAEAVVAGDPIRARNEGFRQVAGYIFGDNAGQASIAMTSPVAQTKGEPQSIAMTSPVAQTASAEGWRIQFFMPAKYTAANLPRPNDPRVRIVELPAEQYAVIRFTGSRDAKAVARHTEQLDAALASGRWSAKGEAVAWFYDPPWTVPFLRRNEVAVPVEARR